MKTGKLVKVFTFLIFLLIFSFTLCPFMIRADEGGFPGNGGSDSLMPVNYFTEEFVKKAIKEEKYTYLSNETIIFNSSKVLGLWKYDIKVWGIWKDTIWGEWMDGLFFYYGGRLFPSSDTLKRYIEYEDYNIILVTQKIGDVEYVCDYLILKKQTPETYLINGPVEIIINGEEYYGGNWEVDLVVNHRWRGWFTDDISQAFLVNSQTRKIEPFIYDTIRLYSEI
jgi:hypothetical protein